MTDFFDQATTLASENVVLSMILHGPHQEATTSSMTGLPSAFARFRTSANGLPSTNGTWTPALFAASAAAARRGETSAATSAAASRNEVCLTRG